jgi:hypothetical protein
LSGLDQSLVQAVRLLANDWPYGWRGTATELVDSIGQYREAGEVEGVAWPRDGRSLSIALRRLVGPLAKAGVRLEQGHRGHAGRRLISVTAASSAASPHRLAKAATGASAGSSRSRADAGDGGYTGCLLLDPNNPEHAALIERMERKEREAQGQTTEAGEGQP